MSTPEKDIEWIYAKDLRPGRTSYRQLRMRDAAGYYNLEGRFYLDANGVWHTVEPDTLVEGKVVAAEPEPEQI